MTLTSTSHPFTFIVLSTSTLGLFALCTTACASTQPSTRACTEEARASVNVIIDDHRPLPPQDDPVELAYSVDGGELMPCGGFPVAEALLNPGESYVCGVEVRGDFIVRLTAGDEVITESVTVRGDECHVTPEVVTLELGGS